MLALQTLVGVELTSTRLSEAAAHAEVGSSLLAHLCTHYVPPIYPQDGPCVPLVVYEYTRAHYRILFPGLATCSRFSSTRPDLSTKQRGARLGTPDQMICDCGCDAIRSRCARWWRRTRERCGGWRRQRTWRRRKQGLTPVPISAQL